MMLTAKLASDSDAVSSRMVARRASTSSMMYSGTTSRRFPFRAPRSRARGWSQRITSLVRVRRTRIDLASYDPARPQEDGQVPFEWPQGQAARIHRWIRGHRDDSQPRRHRTPSSLYRSVGLTMAGTFRPLTPYTIGRRVRSSSTDRRSGANSWPGLDGSMNVIAS